MATIVLKLAKYKTALAIAFTLMMSMLLVVPPAAAQNNNNNAGAGNNNRANNQEGDVFGISDFEKETSLGTKALPNTIAQLTNVALGFLGIVSVVIILFGGFRWMTAAGNDDRVAEAKKIIGAGIVGLIIILASWSIAKFALVKIGQATSAEGAENLQF